MAIQPGFVGSQFNLLAPGTGSNGRSSGYGGLRFSFVDLFVYPGLLEKQTNPLAAIEECLR